MSGRSSRGRAVEHRIHIAAPAEIIWSYLADVDGWSRWSPLYAAARGTAAVGKTLKLAVALPGLKPQKVEATVQRIEPNRRFHYLTVNLGGLVRGSRYMEVEDAGDGGCTVANGEVMGGLLGPLMGRLVGGKVRQGLQAMNEALKPLAEAKVRA